jgi:hypothetical protein
MELVNFGVLVRRPTARAGPARSPAETLFRAALTVVRRAQRALLALTEVSSRSPPAAATVKAAPKQYQNQQHDNEQCGGIHDDLPLQERLVLAKTREQQGRSIDRQKPLAGR